MLISTLEEEVEFLNEQLERKEALLNSMTSSSPNYEVIKNEYLVINKKLITLLKKKCELLNKK